MSVLRGGCEAVEQFAWSAAASDGLAGAFALTRVMASLLHEISPSDPLTFSGVTLLLARVAMLAPGKQRRSNNRASERIVFERLK